MPAALTRGRRWSADDIEDLRRRVTAGEPNLAIAKAYGVSCNALTQVLVKHAIRRRRAPRPGHAELSPAHTAALDAFLRKPLPALTPSRAHGPHHRWRTSDIARLRQRVAEGATNPVLAAEFGVTRKAIENQLHRHGITRAPRPAPRTDRALDRALGSPPA